MKRRTVTPRVDWRTRVEAQGLLFHSVHEGEPQEEPYWAEGVYYEFTDGEIATLEVATRELHARCLDAAAHVIAERRYAELGIPDFAIPLILQSWEEEPPSIYGRMDLAFGQDGVPKLLEYNADTPTSLLEAGVVQWTWLTDVFPELDQFNSIHERLIDAWRAADLDGLVHFGFTPSLEDEMTIGYLRDTAAQAGLDTAGIAMHDIGWDSAQGVFVDLDGRTIQNLFKLYPWEGLLQDPFGAYIGRTQALEVLEPAWKMLLSTKGILPILWELFPNHPNLLPAARAPFPGGLVKKPIHGREGSNVTIDAANVRVETPGPYGREGFIYQAYTDLGCHDGMRPVIGSWIVGGDPAGIGIRETRGYVTDDTARFVPHVITR